MTKAVAVTHRQLTARMQLPRDRDLYCLGLVLATGERIDQQHVHIQLAQQGSQKGVGPVTR